MAHEQRTEAGEGPAHARGFALTSSASVVGKPVDMAHSPTSGSIVSQSRNLGVSSQVLREHFHLPLHTVAHKFGMCTTAFKKMCRRVGIAKWPHRQVRDTGVAQCQTLATGRLFDSMSEQTCFRPSPPFRRVTTRLICLMYGNCIRPSLSGAPVAPFATSPGTWKSDLLFCLTAERD